LRFDDLKSFSYFQKLTKIIIGDNHIGENGAKVIAESLKELKSLTTLSLCINLRFDDLKSFSLFSEINKNNYRLE